MLPSYSYEGKLDTSESSTSQLSLSQLETSLVEDEESKLEAVDESVSSKDISIQDSSNMAIDTDMEEG